MFWARLAMGDNYCGKQLFRIFSGQIFRAKPL